MQLEIPAAIENIDEIMAIYAAEEKVGQRLEKEIRDRNLDNLYSHSNRIRNIETRKNPKNTAAGYR